MQLLPSFCTVCPVFSSRDPKSPCVGVQLVYQASMEYALSSYAENLTNEAKTQYRGKIGVIGGLDPFEGCPGEPCEGIPSVEASDLVAYLVLQTNFITAKQFKAYKSLEAYNQFVCGWVKDVYSWKIAGKFVTTGRVSSVATKIINVYQITFSEY